MADEPQQLIERFQFGETEGDEDEFDFSKADKIDLPEFRL
jgi:hypothetical protein